MTCLSLILKNGAPYAGGAGEFNQPHSWWDPGAKQQCIETWYMVLWVEKL